MSPPILCATLLNGGGGGEHTHPIGGAAYVFHPLTCFDEDFPPISCASQAFPQSDARGAICEAPVGAGDVAQVPRLSYHWPGFTWKHTHTRTKTSPISQVPHQRVCIARGRRERERHEARHGVAHGGKIVTLPPLRC
jgi:hypothetical protein